MSRSIFVASMLLLRLLSSGSVHAQRVEKPPLWEGLPLSNYPIGITSVSTSWKPVGAPDRCVEQASGIQGCPLYTLEAREVTYGDCDTPWIICRCANATMSMDMITQRFGFVPVGIRSYVGGLIVSPDPVASAGTSGDFITFNGECVVPVFIHEAGHSLDAGTSPTPEWEAAVDAGSCVPDSYAQTSQAENFAQVSVVYSYLAKHGSVPGDTTCMKPMLDYVMNDTRISEAQNAEKCLAQRRPFMQTASDRPALGTAGGWEAGGGPAAYVDENSSTSTSSTGGGITGGPTATDSSSKTTVTDVSQSSTRTTRPTAGSQSGASTPDDGAVVIGGKSGVTVALALVLLGLMLL